MIYHTALPQIKSLESLALAVDSEMENVLSVDFYNRIIRKCTIFYVIKNKTGSEIH